MELAVGSLVGLLTTQPKLADVLPSLGHLPKLVQTLLGCVNKGNSQAVIGAVKVFLHLSKSQVMCFCCPLTTPLTVNVSLRAVLKLSEAPIVCLHSS
jgi:hypothetical protein